MRPLAALLLAAVLPAAAPPAAVGGHGVYLTVDEALALAFDEHHAAGRVEKRTVYLTEEQVEQAEELADEELVTEVARPYVASDAEGEVVGVAWFETHRVRSKKETVMVVVSPKLTVARFEVLAFLEPEDYLPNGAFYAQLLGQALDDDLRLDREIRGVTGATLTARATVEATRRALALHAVLFPPPSPEPPPSPAG